MTGSHLKAQFGLKLKTFPNSAITIGLKFYFTKDFELIALNSS